jgi:hypothetical protein
MPFISEIKSTEPKIIRKSWEVREYPSPDQSWSAVLYDPIYWHMGAEGWKLSISTSKTKSDLINSELETISSGKGFICLEDYSPWSADGQIFALYTWDHGFLLLNPNKNSIIKIPISAIAIQWSPKANYLLALSQNELVVLDNLGIILYRMNWRSANYEMPRIGWMKSGQEFFILGRSSKRSKPYITFFDGKTGKILSKERIDPLKYVPYNSEDYQAVHRGSYSLAKSPSTSCVGYLLDTWTEELYDQENGLLLLSIMRPISEVYKKNGLNVCQVEEKWVSVKLNSSL